LTTPIIFDFGGAFLASASSSSSATVFFYSMPRRPLIVYWRLLLPPRPDLFSTSHTIPCDPTPITFMKMKCPFSTSAK